MIMFADRILEIMSHTLKYVAAVLLLIVAVLITLDVVLRFIFNTPIIGIAEIVANGIVVIAFLQLSYAVRIRSMLRSELLLSRLGETGRIVLESITGLLGIILFAIIAWASWEPLITAIATMEFEGHASFQVPTWPVKLAIVGGSILAGLNYLLLILRAIVLRDQDIISDSPILH